MVLMDGCSPALRACWHPVALVEEIDAHPVPVRLLGEAWVLVRLDAGIVALADRCPHRGAPLSAGCVDGGRLRCAYHGWAFAADGACVEIPAVGPGTIPPRAKVPTARVAERAGLVWLAPSEPRIPLPPAPRELASGPPQYLVTDWEASAAHMMDNFLDVGHFAFSHADSFGVADDARSVDMTVARDGWTLTVDHRHHARLLDSDEWTTGEAPPHARRQRFRYDAPFTVRLDIAYDELPDEVVLFFAVQPVDRKRSRLYSAALRNEAAAARCDAAEALRRGLLVVEEDRAVLEQVPEAQLDLSPSAELHTRADRTTLALRRVLADLVQEAGTPPTPTRQPHGES